MIAPKEGPPPPSNRTNSGTQDVQSDFLALTQKTPVDNDFRTAFLKNKLLLVRTHPTLDLISRDVEVKSMLARMGPAASELLAQPIPGGVGYGLFYNQAFKVAWGQATSLAFDIVAPTPPGGNVNTWLYLTGMNRAAMGVEAFVSYDGKGNNHFRVYDWARTSQWQTDIPLSKLTDYIKTDSAHGHPYQVLSVWNTTSQISATTWRNQAHLYNHVRLGWDLFYQYDYPATDAQQKTAFVGSWTAIVETFQPLYSQTNPMGAIGVQVVSADNAGNWGKWAFLAATDASIRTDNVGFLPVFLDPNYAFVVSS